MTTWVSWQRRVLCMAMSCLSAASAWPTKVPAQFFYVNKTMSSQHEDPGTQCTVSTWRGIDPLGMAGYPHAAKIACGSDPGNGFSASGVAVGGWFQIWLAEGQLTFNGETKHLIGSSFWAMEGAYVSLQVNGTAWILGNPFVLDATAKPYTFVDSYNAMRTRSYDLEEAKAGLKKGTLGHDEHICNGTSPSMDFVFGSVDGLDPPSVVVLNCANGSSPEDNFVWSHFHPFGAVYLPFSGKVCFSTDEKLCVEAGEARWTSPNLQYYEYFMKPGQAIAQAEAVRELAGVSAAACERAIVFAVTNFDVTTIAGVPNFDDWPEEAHGQTDCTGIGPWGIFEHMVVRNTVPVSATVTVARPVRAPPAQAELTV